jgi:hypothetical protein
MPLPSQESEVKFLCRSGIYVGSGFEGKRMSRHELWAMRVIGVSLAGIALALLATIIMFVAAYLVP